MSEYTAYVVLAQDLDSDDCEWTVHTGRTAYIQACATARRWVQKQGRWVAQIRDCNSKPEHFER